MSGKTNCLKAWRDFFEAFTDYENHFQDFVENSDLVIISGYSTCSVKALEGPAIWRVRIKDAKIDEWRIYENTEQNRQLLGLER
jgi:hypothetical protein